MKYSGVIPSLYACYDSFGKVDPEGIRRLCRHIIGSGADGVYVCGSAGECLLLTPAERMLILECAVSECGGQIPVIAHVACPTTEDSRRLAAHAASAGADAIAALPPFFYKVSEREAAEYWSAISAAAPGVDFFIYDIPELAPTPLTDPLLETMAQNRDLAGVKVSASVARMSHICEILGEERCVLCGNDGLLSAALAVGAAGGIGGTYAAAPELYTALCRASLAGEVEKAMEYQHRIWRFLESAEERRCSMYALMKEILRCRFGIDAGGVRSPVGEVTEWDRALAERIAVTICDRDR